MSIASADILNYSYNNNKLGKIASYNGSMYLEVYSKYLKIKEYKSILMDSILRKQSTKKELSIMKKREFVYNPWITINKDTVSVYNSMLKSYSKFLNSAHYDFKVDKRVKNQNIKELINLLEDDF
ncbi:hypothetical protein [Clostridium sp. YIM B02551]|uniref:hypothetical protein n=1 Tax=Clostridium sp. YIM B02551 TaxID=2910679 RepID=UPI001EE9F563|nr:hypothetical protein [Clostridium sp. YIM B02551]